MKKFENLGRVLSKNEQKQILGGNPPGGTTGCKKEGSICHVEQDIEYKCSILYNENDEESCCCGHSSYDDNCSSI